MTTLTAARRQLLDGLLAELAADPRLIFGRRAIEMVRRINTRLGVLDLEPDPADDDEIVALWDESGDR